MSTKLALIVPALLLAIASPARAADEMKELAAKAQAVFKAHCYKCHGQEGAIEGGMNYIADLGKLVARKKVVPGDPAASKLFKRIDDGTMPPADEKPRPTDAEIAIVKKWIAAGAPSAASTETRAVISTSDVYNFVLADLETLDRAHALPALLLARASAQFGTLTRSCRRIATRSTSSSTACRGDRRS